MKTKKEHTTSNKIADIIRHEINVGKLKPGAKIIEREIAETYKSSHIPVREALRILEGEGFIIHLKYAGYVVREITPEEMVELYDIVKFLSQKLLNAAVPRYSEITFYQLNEITDEMSKSPGSDQKAMLLVKFVESAYAPAGMKSTFNLAMQIIRRNIPVFRTLVENVYYDEKPLEFQRTFVEYCQKREYERAIEYWTARLDALTKALVAVMSESSKSRKKN